MWLDIGYSKDHQANFIIIFSGPFPYRQYRRHHCDGHCRGVVGVWSCGIPKDQVRHSLLLEKSKIPLRLQDEGCFAMGLLCGGHLIPQKYCQGSECGSELTPH